MITVIFGLPGTGKSYFATRLANKLKAVYVSSDRIRLKLIEKRTYKEAEKMQVYRKMLSLTKMLLTDKYQVVLDGTFYKDEIRQMFMSLASSLEVNISFIEVTADHSLVRKRLEQKRKDSEADYAVYLKVKEAFEPMTQEHLILQSTENNIDEMLQKAIRYLR